MMLALALAQATTSAPPLPTDDVVVIGERLKKWTGRVSTTFGITSRRTTVSTGDRAIDAIGCAALKECWGPARPAYAAALHAKDAGEADRIKAALGQCLRTRRDALVRDLVARRGAAS